MLKMIKSLFVAKKSGNGEHIFVVDDGEIERRVFSHALTDAHFKVTTADSAEKALELMANASPDLILLDFSMPGGMNGREFCSRLKNDEKLCKVPVVFLTGSVDGKDVISCFEVGAEKYLEKPISAKALVRYVRETLDDVVEERGCCSC